MNASAYVSTKFLKSLPFFARLDEHDLAVLQPFFVLKSYDKGEHLFLEGEPCQGVYFVVAGRVRVFKSSPEAREQVLMLAKAGDSFNEVPNFDDGPNPAGAEALEPTTVALLPKKYVLQIMHQYPVVAVATLRAFSRRLRHLASIVEDLSFKQVTSRLAKILLQHAVEDASAGTQAAGQVRGLTQQEMAALIGTAREMVSRSLKTLEARGAIKVERGKITIVDKGLLHEIS